eukprot:RCo006841
MLSNVLMILVLFFLRRGTWGILRDFGAAGVALSSVDCNSGGISTEQPSIWPRSLFTVEESRKLWSPLGREEEKPQIAVKSKDVLTMSECPQNMVAARQNLLEETASNMNTENNYLGDEKM